MGFERKILLYFCLYYKKQDVELKAKIETPVRWCSPISQQPTFINQDRPSISDFSIHPPCCWHAVHLKNLPVQLQR